MWRYTSTEELCHSGLAHAGSRQSKPAGKKREISYEHPSLAELKSFKIAHPEYSDILDHATFKNGGYWINVYGIDMFSKNLLLMCKSIKKDYEKDPTRKYDINNKLREKVK